MKSKADKHREAGTLEQFRARQAASRAGAARYQERKRSEPATPNLEPLPEWLEPLRVHAKSWQLAIEYAYRSTAHNSESNARWKAELEAFDALQSVLTAKFYP